MWFEPFDSFLLQSPQSCLKFHHTYFTFPEKIWTLFVKIPCQCKDEYRVSLLCNWTHPPQEININDNLWPKLSKFNCSKEHREDNGFRAKGFNEPQTSTGADPHTQDPQPHCFSHPKSVTSADATTPPITSVFTPAVYKKVGMQRSCRRAPILHCFFFYLKSKKVARQPFNFFYWHMDLFRPVSMYKVVKAEEKDGSQPISHAAQQRNPLPKLSCGPTRENQCGIGRKLRENWKLHVQI